MAFYLVITIDVEPDCSQTWHYSNPLTFNGVKIGIKEILQPLFNKYGIIPTYLINNVVLEDQNSVNVFKSLNGVYELGTHLHPEFIEPEKTVYYYGGSKGEANCCFYSPEIEYAKIENITNLFKNKFGNKPLSFRAGRFSAGKNTIASLVKLGYLVDTSVTPGVIWDDKSRKYPIDYKTASNQPFYVSNESFPNACNNKELLEVPITIGYLKNYSIKEILKYLMGFKRSLNFKKEVWLRPYFSSFGEIKALIDDIIQGSKDRHTVLNMMFHNVEVIEKNNPYTINQTLVKNYLNDLENILKFCNEIEAKSIELSKLYDIFKE